MVGPTFSPDGTYLCHSDTARRTVFRFRRTASGGIADPAIDKYSSLTLIDRQNSIVIPRT